MQAHKNAMAAKGPSVWSRYLVRWRIGILVSRCMADLSGSSPLANPRNNGTSALAYCPHQSIRVTVKKGRIDQRARGKRCDSVASDYWTFDIRCVEESAV